MDPPKQKVLILGGGFGGIKAALELAGEPAFEVSLLSDQADFRFYPALSRVATGGKTAASSIPLPSIFGDKPVKLIRDSAEKLDRADKIVKGASGKTYPYDVLIIALGVVTNFYGIKGLAKYAYGIKTLDDAHRLRDHLHQQLTKHRAPDLNYVVVGGGATGVMLAADLKHYVERLMANHNLAAQPIHIDLIEAEARLLPRLPRSFARVVTRRLRHLGVNLYLGQKVEAETAAALMVNGQPIASQTVIWTAGVTNHPFFKANDFKLSKHGRVMVDQYLQAEPNIYVIGDNTETKYSGMAQTALLDGKYVAGNLKHRLSGRSPRSYQPVRPVYSIPIGVGWAAVLWGSLRLYGWLGWLLRQVADFKAYHTYQPWWPASQHMLALTEHEEACPTCRRA